MLCTWPAELKVQAEKFYRTDRVARFLDFLAEEDQAWRAESKAQLAFRSAAASQRIYLRCDLDIEEYVNRWLGDDFAKVGEHSRDEVLPGLWPWLQKRGYAASSGELAAFVARLGTRPALLRPGIALERPWPWADAEELDQRGALADEISDAITDVLSALREPLPPACAVRHTAKAEATRKALEDVLIQRARWTHTRLSDGRRKGVELHEETITQDLLLDIAMAMPAMTVETFTKHREARNGADWQWEWWFEGRQWFGLRVQAKRLKRLKSRRLGYDLGYKSGKQLDLLLRDAEPPTSAGGDLSVWAASSYRYIEGTRQADPERGRAPELGLRNRPPNYVTNLLGRGTATATTDDVREDPRLPARVGTVTVFRAAG